MRDRRDRLHDLFEDLEQQASGLHLAELDAELADRATGEYAAVTWTSRAHATVGREVVLTLGSGLVVQGVLEDAGVDWCVVGEHAAASWLVRLAAVATALGISPRSTPEAVRPVTSRLGFRSALRRLAGDGEQVVVHTATGARLPGSVGRVGADFVEVSQDDEDASIVLVTFAGIQAVRVG